LMKPAAGSPSGGGPLPPEHPNSRGAGPGPVRRFGPEGVAPPAVGACMARMGRRGRVAWGAGVSAWGQLTAVCGRRCSGVFRSVDVAGVRGTDRRPGRRKAADITRRHDAAAGLDTVGIYDTGGPGLPPGLRGVERLSREWGRGTVGSRFTERGPVGVLTKAERPAPGTRARALGTTDTVAAAFAPAG